METGKTEPSLGQRWSEARPTKTLTFWSCGATVVATMIVGFTWGGWVTAGTATSMAEALVYARMAPICLAQFKQDPAKDQKLKEFKQTSGWGRPDYVANRGGRRCRARRSRTPKFPKSAPNCWCYDVKRDLPPI